ncbi:nucleoside deaminase [Aciduricibacillus chroicocephali]|uniref:Nucleoside deaminase n=1 Tax=Aciduricibacillus chroicocephali TaxID=3054939 RepID=A0ABY9L123_9BACI|nr:nucleoside deaminase [Bacillaceae bacterium 44XB]
MNNHLQLLERCVELSKQARKNGNTPFGALITGPSGEVIIEQENIEITESNCAGHAETQAMIQASKKYDKQFLNKCTLYSTAEPCAMCAGSAYWGNIGKIVYGITEKRLLELTGNNVQNPTFDLPCREVFARGQKKIEVLGPFPEIEELVIEAHKGFW